MRSTTSLAVSALMLASISLISNCASWGIVSSPALELRELEIDPEAPGAEYWYETCESSIIGICVKKKMVRDTYDFNDPAVRRKLIDMGFILRVRNRPAQ